MSRDLFSMTSFVRPVNCRTQFCDKRYQANTVCVCVRMSGLCRTIVISLSNNTTYSRTWSMMCTTMRVCVLEQTAEGCACDKLIPKQTHTDTHTSTRVSFSQCAHFRCALGKSQCVFVHFRYHHATHTCNSLVMLKIIYLLRPLSLSRDVLSTI